MKALTQQDILAVNGAGSLTVKYTKGDEVFRNQIRVVRSRK